MLMMNTLPQVQPLTRPFTWADFQTGLGQANQQRPQWVTGPTQRSWRVRGGISCSVNPSYMADVQGWKGAGGPMASVVNTARLLPQGATELPLDPDLSVVLDPHVPHGEAHWRAHWDKA